MCLEARQLSRPPASSLQTYAPTALVFPSPASTLPFAQAQGLLVSSFGTVPSARSPSKSS